METGLIGESLRLLVIGMTIVFSFLMLLVACLRLMSWAAARLAPADLHDPSAGVFGSDGQRDGMAPGAADGDLIAVITAAIARYRARHPL